MENIRSKGCEQCKDFWQFSSVPKPKELCANVERQASLYRCENCGSYWEESQRFAVILDELELQNFYDRKLDY